MFTRLRHKFNAWIRAYKEKRFMKKCYRYVEQGWLNKHETDKLVGFKYSLNTTYGCHWDDITLRCRGIVFEKSTGRIVAHPFDKFFNYSEIFAQDGTLAETGKILFEKHWLNPDIVNEDFVATNKIDGSLIICFWYGGEWRLKTPGSFNSAQAVWAKRWFDANVNKDGLVEGDTYCFEVTYKDDVHVVHSEYEGLTLLGAFYANHVEYSRHCLENCAKCIGVPVTEIITGYTGLKDCIEKAKKLDLNYEGYVLAFRDESRRIDGSSTVFRVKVKGDEYIEMFKRINCITYKAIRDRFDCMTGTVDHEYVKSIPEEMRNMREYVHIVEDMYACALEKVKGIVTRISHIEEQRDRYETAVDVAEQYGCRQYVGIAINAVKFGSIDRVRIELWAIVNRELKRLYRDE